MRMFVLAPLLLVGIGGCASNYAGEGALAGGALGAGVGVVTDADTGTAAAIGTAAGAAIGSQVEKRDDRGCWRYDANGRRYWDENC